MPRVPTTATSMTLARTSRIIQNSACGPTRTTTPSTFSPATALRVRRRVAIPHWDREPGRAFLRQLDVGAVHNLRELHEHERFPGYRFWLGGQLWLRSRIRFRYRRRE